jgi:hypothetical protein
MIKLISSRLYFLLAIIGIMVFGWISLLRQRSETIKRRAFASDFLDHFQKYIDSRGENESLYGWLTYNSVKMQKQLGPLGIAASWIPPGASYLVNKVPIIVQILPELYRTINDRLLSGFNRLSVQFAQTIHEVLLRHLCVVDEELELIRKSSKNPIIAFRQGIQLLVFLPLYILNWLGIIASSSIISWKNKMIIRTFLGLVAIISFVSSVVGLVLDWPNFISLVGSLLGK